MDAGVEGYDIPGSRLAEVPLLASRLASVAGARGAESALAAMGLSRNDVSDPLGLGDAALRFWRSLALDPRPLVDAQIGWWRDGAALWGSAWQRALGFDTGPVVGPDPADRRFRHDAWRTSPGHDLVKQTYLLWGRACAETVANARGLDGRDREKLRFAVSHVVDALAPSNFVALNPAVLERTLATGGDNLVRGLENLVDDLEASGGRLRPRMAERNAFELGVDLATTPGKVVFENDLIQLIQYAPATGKVFERPLLILPPWMNKYYVLDLAPDNSMVKWLVEQGYTVFIVSWVNPDERLAAAGFDDYLERGALAALDAVERATGESSVNMVGYCLGGILLAAFMAWLAARGDTRVKSASYLTTMVDFCDVGEVSLFIDEETLAPLEASIERRGYLSGKLVADTFSALRANDLIWSFFVDSYLLGNSPRPFDILYWNSDSTNMPAAMHTFFMRNMYVENRMREPGGITLAGEPIDVTKVTAPAYILSTSEDHIAPWRTTYFTTGLFEGPTRFVLGQSGHIAGVVNPPARGKYGYLTNEDLPAEPEAWLAGAREHAGSWWPDWHTWMQPHRGPRVAAREPGAGELPVIEDAPGRYALTRVD